MEESEGVTMNNSRVNQLFSSPEFFNKPIKDQLAEISKNDPEFFIGPNGKPVSPETQHRILFDAQKGSFNPKPAGDVVKEEEDWLAKNAGDFVDNTPLTLLKNPSITDKTQNSSPAVGGLGGSDIGEMIFGGAYSIPRDIISSLWEAGKNLTQGDPGAALGQAATLGLPKVFGKTGRGLRSSAERNMVQILDPVEDVVPRAQELAPKMLDDFDAGAFTRQGLVDKVVGQKQDRMNVTKPIEDLLAPEKVDYNPVFDQLGKFLDDQGRYPVGKNLDRSKAGIKVAEEAKDLFFTQQPGTPPNTSTFPHTPGTPSKTFVKDTNFGDLLKGKQGWGETAKEIFNQPPAFRDPTLTPRAEASGAAWGGAKSELERVAKDAGFDDYPRLNTEISDLIDIEKMSSRGMNSGTFLGTLPNRVLGWLPSSIGGRVLGGELGSRVPRSVGLNTSSAYIKDMLASGLKQGSRLSPAEMAILNAMLQEEQANAEAY